MPILVWSLLFVSLSTVYDGAEGKTDLHIVSMLPYPGKGYDAGSLGKATWQDGPDIIPAIHLAIEQINEREDILSDYTLNLLETYEGCNYTPMTYLNTVKTISGSLTNTPISVGIIGPRCTDSALALSELTSISRISTLTTHLGTVPALGNRTRFPYAFGLADSVSLVANGLVEMVTHNNWKKISVLYSEADTHYYTTFQEFSAKPRAKSEFAIEVSAPVSKSYFPLRDIRDSYTRVILAMTVPEISLWLLCLAYHEHIVFPTYQWVFLGRQLDNLRDYNFTYEGKRYSCSVNLLRRALYGSISVVLDLQDANGQMLYSKQTYDEYNKRYEEKVALLGSRSTVWANPIYDAIWALALALNATEEMLKQTGGQSLVRYRYDRSISSIIADQFYHVRFAGVSGLVSFDNNTGFTTRSLQIKQYSGNSCTVIGAYNKSDGLKFTGTPVFVSSDFTMEVDHVFSLTATLCILTVTVIPLLLALSTQIIGIMYRRYRPIKVSSYKLNQIAYAGCYLTFAGIIMVTVVEAFSMGETVQNVFCATAPWSLNVGLTLVLGTMCVKSWRLYHIFSASSKLIPLTNQVYLKDPALAIGITAVVLVQILLCGLRAALDRPVWSELSTSTSDSDTPVHTVVMTCASKHQNIWLSAEITYKALISLFALGFALSTRKGHQKGYEGKSVVILVYAQAVVSGFVTPSALLVTFSDISEVFTLLIFLGYFIVVLYLCVTLLFVPPVVLLFRAKQSTYRHESIWSTRPSIIRKNSHPPGLYNRPSLKRLEIINFSFDQPLLHDAMRIHVETPL